MTLASAHEGSEGGERRPLLSICIPSYNRQGHLEKLLHCLSANLLDDTTLAVEVIVVNNASTDGTHGMLADFPDKRIRVIHRDAHLATAEENVFHSVDYCRGNFVWFLGDDDVPVLANFASHYALLAEGAHDFVLFNPAIIDSHGSLAVLQNVKMNRYSLELPVSDLVVTIGCFFTLAGISNGIMRRRLLSSERGLHYMRISQIYSMVAWMIEAARDARCAFVNAPLVYYRENDYNDGHWPRVAKRLGVGDHHFWSIGVVALLEELIAQGCLSAGDVGRITEVNRDGHRYSLLDDILFKFYLQFKAAARDASPRQLIAGQQMARAASFFAKADPTTYDLAACLRNMAAAAQPFEKLEEEFLQLFNERQATGQWARRVRHVYKGYEILETPVQFTAICQGHGLREAVMATIDPLPTPPTVLVAATWSALASLIDQATISGPIVAVPTLPQSTGAALAPVPPGAEYVKLAGATNDALQQLANVYKSNSWQITYPCRSLRVIMRRIVGTLLGRP